MNQRATAISERTNEHGITFVTWSCGAESALTPQGGSSHSYYCPICDGPWSRAR